MSTEEKKTAALQAADNIATMYDALKEKGFNHQDTITLVSSMLSGATVYTPFAAMSATPVDLSKLN